MTAIATALIAAGYQITAVTATVEYFTRGENDSVVSLTETGRVLFHNADGDGQWMSADQAVARVAVAA